MDILGLITMISQDTSRSGSMASTLCSATWQNIMNRSFSSRCDLLQAKASMVVERERENRRDRVRGGGRD